MDPFGPIQRHRNHTRREVVQEWNWFVSVKTSYLIRTENLPTFMLFKSIKGSCIEVHRLLTPAIDLSRYSPPEYLVKHRVGHVIISAPSLVFRNGEGMLQSFSFDQKRVQRH